ncbi:MAG: cobalamin-dependent protein [Spirochaetota bacterium]|nr:cobalamin-dependent protein [Spirochaetota bacterium]
MTQQNKKIKAIMARFSLDGHDRGLLSLMNSFKNAGFEVVYTFFHDSSELVKVAKEEDADVIGITSNMGQHFYVASEIIKALKEQNVDVPVIMGGVIPTRDVQQLLDIGIKRVFRPGSTPDDAIAYISDIAV